MSSRWSRSGGGVWPRCWPRHVRSQRPTWLPGED